MPIGVPPLDVTAFCASRQFARFWFLLVVLSADVIALPRLDTLFPRAATLSPSELTEVSSIFEIIPSASISTYAAASCAYPLCTGTRKRRPNCGIVSTLVFWTARDAAACAASHSALHVQTSTEARTPFLKTRPGTRGGVQASGDIVTR